MDRGTHRALIAVVFLAAATALAAQNPPPAAPPAPGVPDTTRRDSLARQLVLDEMFAVGQSAFAPRVVLTEGTVYRLEIQPATASIRVHSARRLSLPPLFLVPLEGGGPVGANQTAAFLLVPRSTEEYRFDVVVDGTEPVRVRVWTDPREMSRYARMREATRNLPMAGLGLRAAYLGSFVRAPAGTAAGTASATGIEACLAVVPRGEWISGPVGGCVLILGRYWRPGSTAGMWYIGTEPRYELSRPGTSLETSVTATVGIGTSVSSKKMDVLALGLGLEAATPVPATHRRLWLEADAGLTRMQQLAGGPETIGPAKVVPRLGLGLQLRF